jgi:hypothetical protein
VDSGSQFRVVASIQWIHVSLWRVESLIECSIKDTVVGTVIQDYSTSNTDN